MPEQVSTDVAIARLEAMDRAALAQIWTKAFGSSPAKTLSLAFLRRVLAHDGQCREFGGLSHADRRSLQSFLDDKSPSRRSAAPLTAGAHLVREWQGRTYQVEVLDGGYRFDVYGRPFGCK